jgi:hypothetical protein
VSTSSTFLSEYSSHLSFRNRFVRSIRRLNQTQRNSAHLLSEAPLAVAIQAGLVEDTRCALKVISSPSSPRTATGTSVTTIRYATMETFIVMNGVIVSPTEKNIFL